MCGTRTNRIRNGIFIIIVIAFLCGHHNIFIYCASKFRRPSQYVYSWQESCSSTAPKTTHVARLKSSMLQIRRLNAKDAESSTEPAEALLSSLNENATTNIVSWPRTELEEHDQSINKTIPVPRKRHSNLCKVDRDSYTDDKPHPRHYFGDFMGYIATVIFLLQPVPQIALNRSRGSVRGYSSLAVGIKMLGASFLMTNYIVLRERLPTRVYAVICVVQLLILLIQAALYERRRLYLYFCCTPVPCWWLATFYPSTMTYSTWLKPITQIVAHFPVLATCIRERSMKGISFLSIHCNALGGMCGLLMCTLVELKSPYTTTLIYFNSLLQALTLYALIPLYGNNELEPLVHDI